MAGARDIPISIQQMTGSSNNWITFCQWGGNWTDRCIRLKLGQVTEINRNNGGL